MNTLKPKLWSLFVCLFLKENDVRLKKSYVNIPDVFVHIQIDCENKKN